MDNKFTMDVLETMAQMLEVLVARIEMLEKKLNESCSCHKWASNFRPDVIFEPCTLGSDLSPQEIEDLMAMK